MNTAINSMRKDLSKNKKYSEKFVTYMGTIFDEAENDEN